MISHVNPAVAEHIDAWPPSPALLRTVAETSADVNNGHLLMCVSSVTYRIEHPCCPSIITHACQRVQVGATAQDDNVHNERMTEKRDLSLPTREPVLPVRLDIHV